MGLDPTKKLAIQKQPIMDHMKRLDPLKGNAGKIGDYLKDGVIDEGEAKELGLDGSRSYDITKEEDVTALNDIKSNTTNKASSTMKDGEKPPTHGLE